jgi:DNA-binding CsgD family transcriptional regulator
MIGFVRCPNRMERALTNGARSALMARRPFHNLCLYADFFAKIPVEHQMTMTVSRANTVVVGFAFNRSTRDFSEADREILGVLRAPLLNGLLRCRARWRANTALSTPESDLLACLTDRELRVLELVAVGRTNQAIAHAMRISPRTVAKYLEHTYRKLDVTNRAAAAARLSRDY